MDNMEESVMVKQNKSIDLNKYLIWLVAFIILTSGLFLVYNGTRLMLLGGSRYFIIMGLAMLFSAINLFKFKPIGAIIYGVAYIFTIIWALFDVGFQFWPLFSRLAIFGGFAMLVAFIHPPLMWINQQKKTFAGYLLGSLIAFSLAITLYFMFEEHNIIYNPIKIDKNTLASYDTPTDWQHYANTTKGTRFSGADQITKENVNQLEVAWIYRSGYFPENNDAGAEDQNTPLQIEDTIYLCSANNVVIAIDADSGAQKWRYDPQNSVPNWQRCRGLAYYADTMSLRTNQSKPNQSLSSVNSLTCSQRIILNTLDARLIEINAQTGELCKEFGDNGIVDLTKNISDRSSGYYTMTSVPLVADNIIVIGGRVAGNLSMNESGGIICGYDIYTGKLIWSWDPDNTNKAKVLKATKSQTRSSINILSSMAYDPDLDLIYVPTGNAPPDFFGGLRTKYDDEFNSSIIALNRKTGEINWTFRTVHHDLWNYGLPSQPLLYDIPDDNGGVYKALIQTTKSGQIFMLDRVTGQPLAKVEHRLVPKSNINEEYYAATQPFSVEMPSIGNQTLTEADMWGLTPFDQLLCRIDFVDSEYAGLFTPPGLKKTLQYPGAIGGMNWGSAAVDPQTNIMYVNDIRIGQINWMIPREEITTETDHITMDIVTHEKSPYGAIKKRFMSPIGVPCQKPPYGTMTAIDLKSKQVLWQKPLGTVIDTNILDLPIKMSIPIGLPTNGGPMVTKSGLLFFAATQDFYLRAMDSTTGKEIWKTRLPVGSQGTPITYISPKTGKQYIIISAGGAKGSSARGDYVIAYALPDVKQSNS